MRAQPVGMRRIGVAAAVAAALLTSACAAGQHAQTAEQRPTLDGNYATVGNIALRGVAIVTPSDGTFYTAGSDAPVRLVIVNTASNANAKADQLVSVSSPAASGWAAYPTLADAQLAMRASSSSVPSGASSAPTGAPVTAGESLSSGASPTATASPVSPGSAPQPLTSVSIGPGQRTSFGVPDTTQVLLLVGLKQKLYPGSTVPITFTFADAGAVTVPVPVQLSESPNSSVLPVPSASGAA